DLAIELYAPYRSVDIGPFESMAVLFNDATGGKLTSAHSDIFYNLLGIIIGFIIFSYLLNFFILVTEMAIAGLFVYAAGRLLRIDLFSKIFFPSGRKYFSLNSGWVFSFNSLIVPFRIAYYFISGILAILLVLLKLHPAIKKRFEKKPDYIAPEIQLETFRTGEAIENLTPVETAVFLNRPSKAVQIIVMDLFSKGYLDIINRNPLQIKILKEKDDSLAQYESAFLDSIASDGTLAKNSIPVILKSVTTSLQGKIWKADIEKTAEVYSKKVESHWNDFTAHEPARRRSYFEENHPWIIINDSFSREPDTWIKDIVTESGTEVSKPVEFF
ncbi:MAG TPA: DUF2207 domain-containing protein, partial [Spirochaetota bacterium]|nr:DUF2207 domain-containing protein [Spirochaetota bacterium]